MGEQPLRLGLTIFGDPEDYDRDGKSVANLCDEIDALVLSYGFTLTDDCMIVERGSDPLAEDAYLAKERADALRAFEEKQNELIERSGEITDDGHFQEIRPFIERVVRAQQGFLG